VPRHITDEEDPRDSEAEVRGRAVASGDRLLFGTQLSPIEADYPIGAQFFDLLQNHRLVTGIENGKKALVPRDLFEIPSRNESSLKNVAHHRTSSQKGAPVRPV
jgi:hypothetical protein